MYTKETPEAFVIIRVSGGLNAASFTVEPQSSPSENEPQFGAV